MSHRSKLFLVSGCASIILLAGSMSAYAATSSPSDPSSSVEEVVVTAQKRTELLREVPASVTAVTGSTLQNLGAARLDDYVARIPGLTVSNVTVVNGSNQLSIRGITTGIGSNPTVGVYIDDSPFGGSTQFSGYTVPDLDPQDLQRVEVLRGPQGTLYGAGSLGGLLKYVTAQPDPSHFFGRMEVDGSTVDGGGQGYGLRASANVPINDKIALRVSGYDRQDPGYVDNVLTGEDNINSVHAYGGRVALGVQVNDDWKVRLSGLVQHQRGRGPVVDYDATTFQPVYGDLKQSRAFGTEMKLQDLAAYNLEIEGRLGDFATLTSATGYDRRRMFLDVDYSQIIGPIIQAVFGIPNVGTSFYNDPVGVDKFVQEVRLTSPADNKIAWLLGAFYTHERTDISGRADPFNVFTGAPVAGLPLFYRANTNTTFEEKAVFGDVTYHFSPAFDITGGVRFSHNNQETVTLASGLINGGLTDTDVKSSDSSVTWLINPRFHVTPDTMVYARIATGYRPGGPNTGLIGTPLTFGPDKVTNYEVGLKSDLFDRRVSLELAAFWIDWKDIQIPEVNPSAQSFIANGSTAVSRGVEATASWRPVTGLQLYGNVSYQDAYITKAFPAGGAIALEGDRLPLTPLWSGDVGGDYHFPLAGQWNGQVGADWRHVGPTLGAFPNPGALRFEHPTYEVVDLRAGVNNDRWTLMVYAKNIGDSRGQTADINLGINRVAVIQPRTFAVSLSTTF